MIIKKLCSVPTSVGCAVTLPPPHPPARNRSGVNYTLTGFGNSFRRQAAGQDDCAAPSDDRLGLRCINWLAPKSESTDKINLDGATCARREARQREGSAGVVQNRMRGEICSCHANSRWQYLPIMLALCILLMTIFIYKINHIVTGDGCVRFNTRYIGLMM